MISANYLANLVAIAIFAWTLPSTKAFQQYEIIRINDKIYVEYNPKMCTVLGLGLIAKPGPADKPNGDKCLCGPQQPIPGLAACLVSKNATTTASTSATGSTSMSTSTSTTESTSTTVASG